AAADRYSPAPARVTAAGARGNAAHTGGRGNCVGSGGAGATQTANVREVVRAAGPAVSQDGDAARPGAVRPSSAPRPRLHGRRRGSQAGLYASQDPPDALSRGIRPDRG